MFRRVVLIFVLLAGCRSAPPAPTTAVAPNPPEKTATAAPPFLLHLPGIGGARSPDYALIRGLRDGGYDGEIEIFDWTDQDPGLPALLQYDRNQRKAQLLADKITRIRRASPGRAIILTGHSGGTGIAVWALERLPGDVSVDRVLLLSSALSPMYDLSSSLRHVKDKMYNFWSPQDVTVLNAGTALFGTMDGVKTPAAGFGGFMIVNNADMVQYRKLEQIQYSADWKQWGNDGGHVGPMHEAFSDHVLAPFVIEPSILLQAD